MVIKASEARELALFNLNSNVENIIDNIEEEIETKALKGKMRTNVFLIDSEDDIRAIKCYFKLEGYGVETIYNDTEYEGIKLKTGLYVYWF